MNNLFTLFCVALFLTAPAQAVGSDQVAVVVNVSNTLSELKQKELENIFMGRTSTFPNGEPAVPRDQASSGVKEAFYQTYFSLSLDEIHDFWIREVYRGGRKPPIFVDTSNDSAMKSWISQNRNGIGYLGKSTLDATVKEIQITDVKLLKK